MISNTYREFLDTPIERVDDVLESFFEDANRLRYLLTHARRGSLEAFVAITQLDHMHEDGRVREAIDRAMADESSYPKIR